MESSTAPNIIETNKEVPNNINKSIKVPNNIEAGLNESTTQLALIHQGMI
jgi:hypothetical protein